MIYTANHIIQIIRTTTDHPFLHQRALPSAIHPCCCWVQLAMEWCHHAEQTTRSTACHESMHHHVVIFKNYRVGTSSRHNNIIQNVSSIQFNIVVVVVEMNLRDDHCKYIVLNVKSDFIIKGSSNSNHHNLYCIIHTMATIPYTLWSWKCKNLSIKWAINAIVYGRRSRSNFIDTTGTRSAFMRCTISQSSMLLAFPGRNCQTIRQHPPL